ncbi:citrate synthase [Duganella sp. 1411]|uniref:citrate synthase family protein n=1 Tax=Duganella sp. 1411 TaxID=2806572 RepID=UPI001AE44368|nr:citrate synthase family protein [Duganella sp. 1411]MBP1204922.1 citrate synthase [Duganella sp. 1411]
MVWMTAAEALTILNVRPQTLYANVSRGKIRAKADDADPRRSLYHRDDVLRMARRANGRRKIDAVSAQAMQWGDPVLPSSISTTADGRLLYRGQDAAVLAASATLEEVAALLWECDASRIRAALPARHDAPPAAAAPTSFLGACLSSLATLAASDAPSLARPADELRADAATILATLTETVAGPPPDGAAGLTISARLAHAWGRPNQEDLIRRALVLMADHELNASTFAARVAVSTGASLAAGVLAGLATLSGPLHGGASAQFARLLALARQTGARDAVAQWLAGGRPLPGFGHPLYPEGDPRARALLEMLPKTQPHAALAAEAEAQAGELPTVDFALPLLAATCGLPDDAPLILFTLGRCVGWLAHALEQAQANRPIRPRARYVGPA